MGTQVRRVHHRVRVQRPKLINLLNQIPRTSPTTTRLWVQAHDECNSDVKGMCVCNDQPIEKMRVAFTLIFKPSHRATNDGFQLSSSMSPSQPIDTVCIL